MQCLCLFATGSYSELDDFSPEHVDIILPSTPTSSKYSEDALLLTLRGNTTSKRNRHSCDCNCVSDRGYSRFVSRSVSPLF
jgi:hypothetical protein